jgi:adenine-specific DNA methylase
LTRYGITTFQQVFHVRQQIALFTLARLFRDLPSVLAEERYDEAWLVPVSELLALGIGRMADYNSEFCTWNINQQGIGHTFARFALPMTTDYAESNPIGSVTGSFAGAVEWTALCVEHLLGSAYGSCVLSQGSAEAEGNSGYDVVMTDPPYYDSIPYSDISDYFYVWLRRSVGERHPRVFAHKLVSRDREIIQHAGRMDGNNEAARKFYEDGMARSFAVAWRRLSPDGRMVVVFAHKQPDAWETLVSAMIRVGFVVTGSWPIQTERPAKTAGGARLASSVWLVCRKRPTSARPGWDNKVLEEMRANIAQRLRGFWDAGIRGPDFVWAATGPALEAYSKHPVVKMANDPGQTLTVSEFLNHARRMVVDFVVGRVLEKSGEAAVEAAVDRLDEATAYYLLHRNDFGMDEAPVGACILYATACSLSDQELIRDWDLLVKTGGDESVEKEEEDADGDEEPSVESGSGSKVKLKAWNQRRGRSMGYEAPGGRPVPLIDRVHRLMHLWKGGDVHKVDEYLDEHGLRRHELFRRVLQSLIELSKPGSEERSLLESLSNHIGAKGAKKKEIQPEFPEMANEPREVE